MRVHLTFKKTTKTQNTHTFGFEEISGVEGGETIERTAHAVTKNLTPIKFNLT